MQLALLLLLGVSGVKGLIAPNLTFTLSLSDMSPLIQFQNTGSDPSPRPAGWEVRYSDSPGTPPLAPGAIGAGTSSHVGTFSNTTSPGVVLYFAGKGVTVRGSVSGSTSPQPMVAFLNGQGVVNTQQGFDAGNRILARAEVPWDVNRIHVWLGSPGTVTVDSIDVDTGMVAEVDFIDQVKRDKVPTVVNGGLNPVLTEPFTSMYGAAEIVESIGNGTASFPHVRIKNGQYVQVKVPNNTSFVMMNGTVGPESGEYFVTCQPQVPFHQDDHYTAYSQWTASDVLLWYAAFDPAVQYTCAMQTPVRPANGSEGGVGVSSFTVFSASKDGKGTAPSPYTGGAGGAGKSKPNIGGIVGGVVGGVVGLALIGGLLWWFCHRRRPETKASRSVESLKINGELEPTPYRQADAVDPAAITVSPTSKLPRLGRLSTGATKTSFDDDGPIASPAHDDLIHRPISHQQMSYSGDSSTPPQLKSELLAQAKGQAPPPTTDAEVGEDMGRLEVGPPRYNEAWERE